MHYVYVLQRGENDYYIGYSTDLVRRVKQHAKEHPGYTLSYYEAYKNAVLARRRERLLKHYGSAWRGLKKRMAA